MKKLLSTISCFFVFFSMTAQDVPLRFNYVSSEQNNIVQPFTNICYGGNAILNVEYVGNWPLNAMGAFEYACRLFENTMQETYPINIKAVWDTSDDSYYDSPVLSSCKAYTGQGYNQSDVEPYYSFYKASCYLHGQQPDTSFWYAELVSYDEYDGTDIELRYYNNRGKIVNNCDFSIDEDIENGKYDFVTVVLRDLFKCYGVDCKMTYDSATNTIDTQPDHQNFFDLVIANNLATNGFDVNNSDGYMELYHNNIYSYEDYGEPISFLLYAPSAWDEYQSFNYFIPVDGDPLTQIMRPNFGKNCVLRNIIGDYRNFFKCYLAWTQRITVGMRAPSRPSYVIEMNELTDISQIDYDEYTYSDDTLRHESRGTGGDYFFNDFPISSINYLGALKKDGTFDTILNEFEDDFVITEDMFHYPISDYARDANGCIKAKVAKPYEHDYRWISIKTPPQKIEIRKGIFRLSLGRLASTVRACVDIKNLEGADRVIATVVDGIHNGPYTFEVEDFKNGHFYFDAKLGVLLSVTLTAYNSIGSTQSDTYTFRLTKNDLIHEDNQGPGDIIIGPGTISVQSEDGNVVGIDNYTVHSTLTNINETNNTTLINNAIDITNLSNGFHVVNITTESGERVSKQFFKN